MICTTNSKEASQGSFTLGYIATFETVGSNVTMSFELLDDKAGVVAYAFKKSPFSETAMTNVGGKKFSFTLGGLTAGQTISYACKFAFAGGMAVTKYFDYVVGTSCGVSAVNALEQKSTHLFPNPVQDMLKLSSDINIEQVVVRNLTGQTMLISKFNSNEGSIHIGDFAPGSYFVTIKFPNGKLENHKIIKL